MADTPQNEALKNIASVVTNKRSRSFIFIIITFVLILVANGLMPIISGRAKYTTEAQEVTYAEYLVRQEEDPLVSLTYASQADIEDYVKLYIKANPDLTPEQYVTITPPNDMKVSVYTKLFFQSYWWYIDTAIHMISTVLLFYAIFNYLTVQSKETNPEYLNGVFTMKQLNENYLDPDTFEPWTEDVFNKTRKIKQHIRNVKHELKKLERKTPYIIRKKFMEHFENFDRPDYVYNPNIPSTLVNLDKKEQAYVDKKEELITQLRDKYINEVVVLSEVKNFREIKPGFVYSGVDSNSVGQDEYSTIKTDGQRIQKTIMSKIFVSLAISLSFASLLTVLAIDSSIQSPLFMVLSVIMKVTPLILQIYFAFNYNNWFVDNQLLPNLKFRENIAMMYLAEMKRQGKQIEPVIINKFEVVATKKERKKEVK